MATKHYYFSGNCQWAKLAQPDTKFNPVGEWKIDLFLDGENLNKLRDSGVQLKEREFEGKPFVTFKRAKVKIIKGKPVEFDPPTLLDVDGEKLNQELPIGNGSTVTCKVSVYDTMKGKGHTLEAVRVDELVVYNKDEDRPDEGQPF